MIVLKGDLFESGLPAIGHGVNCRGIMGGGIALEFRKKYPKMFQDYTDLCSVGGLAPGDVFPWQTVSGKWIYNIASQQNLGNDARLHWLATASAAALDHAASINIASIGIPAIGTGIGGLNIKDVIETLEQVECNRESYFVMYLI